MDKERQIVNTNIRLNLRKEEDRKAWEYLCKMDRKMYKSYSRVVVIAINDYFDRMEALKREPDLENRLKEDEFLERVIDVVEREVDQKVTEKVLSLSSREQMTSLDEKIEVALGKTVSEQLPAILQKTLDTAIRDNMLHLLYHVLQGTDTGR